MPAVRGHTLFIATSTQKGTTVSITFWMPQAPVERVKPYDDEPDYYEVRCVPPFVEVNMTACNANAILALIDPDSVDREGDPCGTWDQAALARVRTATIRALNTRMKERAYVDPFIRMEPLRARMFSGGRDAEYVERRLDNFLALTKVAMEHGFSVSFG